MKPDKILIILIITYSCHQPNSSNPKPADSGISKKPAIAADTNTTSLPGEDFLSFWQKFRPAVINFDTIQLKELTEFPFETRGPDDNDPTINYSKKKFVRVFKAFLNQVGRIESNDSARTLTSFTELEEIKKTDTPNKKDILPDQARIGNLWFHKTGKKWKLAFAYLEYDTIDSLKN